MAWNWNFRHVLLKIFLIIVKDCRVEKRRGKDGRTTHSYFIHSEKWPRMICENHYKFWSLSTKMYMTDNYARSEYTKFVLTVWILDVGDNNYTAIHSYRNSSRLTNCAVCTKFTFRMHPQ